MCVCFIIIYKEENGAPPHTCVCVCVVVYILFGRVVQYLLNIYKLVKLSISVYQSHLERKFQYMCILLLCAVYTHKTRRSCCRRRR